VLVSPFTLKQVRDLSPERAPRRMRQASRWDRP